MKRSELARREEKAETEALIVSKTDGGYRVFSPLAPANQWLVCDTGDDITCTCPDYHHHADDPEWCCKHILAVQDYLAMQSRRTGSGAASAAPSNGSLPSEGPPAPKKQKSADAETSMLIKRSISPDGRSINSLSVEFSVPITKCSTEEMRQRAEKVLEVQSTIVEEFRKQNPPPPPPPANVNGAGANSRGIPNGSSNGNGARLAQLLGIGGMNGKFGRRLFINVLSDNQTLKFFGSEKQLSDALAAAGYPNMSTQVREGVDLNLGCRIITKPSPDGRYVNVEQLLPLNGG